MGQRRIRRMQRQVDMKLSRRKNGALKLKERERRRTRMVAILKAGKLPYTPPVMSWLSGELDMPSTRIKQTDVDAFVQ